MMHGTRLARRDTLAAVVDHVRRRTAAEGERRGHDAGNLAREPEENDPR
jgi:hypothetical protein